MALTDVQKLALEMVKQAEWRKVTADREASAMMAAAYLLGCSAEDIRKVLGIEE